MKKVLLSILFVSVATLANAQKSEVAEAKRLWGIFQISLSMNSNGTKKEVADPASANAAINSMSASSRIPGRGVTKYGTNTPSSAPSVDNSKPKISSGSPVERQLASLNEGLSHIDKAVVHEKTKDLLDTWVYKALYTSAIALIDTVNAQNSLAKQKDAEIAIARAKTLDVKGEEKSNIENAEINITNAIRTRALGFYNKKDYASALANFNELIKINPSDTSMYINAGVTAKLLENYPEAIKNFKKVISFNVPETKNFYAEAISMTLVNMKDTTAGLALLTEALAKYPDDAGFVGTETDIYITKGDIVKSQESLKKLIAKDASKAIYQYLMGDTYYKQALALQVDRSKLDAKKTKEFDAITAKMVALIDQSLPYYRKAMELDPKYVPALETLKQIYGFKNDSANFEDIKKKLDAIPAN